MAVLYKGEIMLSSKVINYLEQKNAWFEDVDIDCERYREILKELNLDTSSDFGIFYTHAEENPGGFYSKNLNYGKYVGCMKIVIIELLIIV